MWLLLLLTACGPVDDGFTRGGSPTDDDDSAPVGAWIECPEGGCGLELAVQEATDLPPPCPDEACVEEYLLFAELAAELATPVDPDALEDDVLSRMRSGDIPEPPEVDAATLRSELREATGTAFLFEDLDTRPLQIEEIDRIETDWGREEHLVIRDPWIGSIGAVLLRPNGTGPFPGLVAVAGHGDDWWDMRDAYHGAEIADASWAVLIVDARVSGADDNETLVTRTLLEAGLSFAGVRAYEQLLGRKILRWRWDVHPEFVGVWGHSGGSITANLANRIEGFDALVIDLQGHYLNAGDGAPWLDETSPALHAWYPAINDLSTLDVPHYQDLYGYPGGASPIRSFLRGEVLGL